MGVTRNKIPPELYGRYDIVPARSRALKSVVAIGLLVSGVLLLFVGGNLQAGGETRLITWQQLSASEVSVTWSVERRDNQPVTCVLRVQDEARFDTGYAVTRVRGTATNPTFTTVVQARGEIFAVPTPVCSVGGPDSILGSHFRPGVLPPAQDNGLAAPWQSVSWLN